MQKEANNKLVVKWWFDDLLDEAAHENAQRHRQLSCHGMMNP
jgi:hypothetical protein